MHLIASRYNNNGTFILYTVLDKWSYLLTPYSSRITHTNVMNMEASILTLSLLALRMVPSIVDTVVQINNAFVVSLSVNSLQQISD